jgi:hypothetical protein
LLLPDVFFGSPEAGSLDWRDEVFDDGAPDDDAELAETPEDVAALLGFDPLDEA